MQGSRKIRTELGKVAQIEDLKKLAEMHISTTEMFTKKNTFIL